MARRRYNLTFQPQAGSVSREIDIIGRRGATDIANIGRKIRAKRRYEREVVQSTLNNIDNLMEESALIHQEYAADEIAKLKDDVFNLFAKKNKKGKVRGFDIYDPQIRNFVQGKVNEFSKIINRSEPTYKAMQDALKAVGNDDTILDKTKTNQEIIDLANDKNTLLSNRAPEDMFLEVIFGAKNPELLVNNSLAELTKNDETSSKTFSKKEIINKQNVKTEERLDYNLDVVRVDGTGNFTFDNDKIDEYTDILIKTNPLKFKEENRADVKLLVQDFFKPKSIVKEDISPVTGDGKDGDDKVVFNAKTDVNTYKFDELNNNIPTLKGYNFSTPLSYQTVEPLEGEDVLKKYKVLGLRENNEGKKLVYAYTGAENIGEFQQLILQSDLDDILTKDDEDLTTQERETKVEILNKLGGLDELEVLPFNETIYKDLKISATKLEKEQEGIARAGLDYFLNNSLFTDEERKNDDPLGIL
jgi:hypothetical protein